MARDLNKVQFTGRLGADPEIRTTAQGSTVATFRVASNRTWISSNGEPHEDTEWFRVVAWNRLAEISQLYLHKASRVYVEGRLQTRQWVDQQGQTRYVSEVIASDILLLDGRHTPHHSDFNDAHASLNNDEAPY
jgi:single-strand DNA-binding protein